MGHQCLVHDSWPVEHDHRGPSQLQAEHIPIAAPQLQREGHIPTELLAPLLLLTLKTP